MRYRRVVVKIGTKVLAPERGGISDAVLGSIVEQVASLVSEGTEVVLVSSGAVGSGRGSLPVAREDETIEDKQVLAAIGQVKLMATYARLFAHHSLLCAQVLVTKEDFRDRGHYQNMRRCFENLLRDGVVPVVNENDVVAIKELVFTDNDELAGLVASQLGADALIILTSVDGVLAGSPSDSSSKTIPVIDLTTLATMQRHISNEKTDVGRGGMVTKFAVARRLMSSGIAVHIARGQRPDVVRDIMQDVSVGTVFRPTRKVSGTKRRIAHAAGLTAGALTLNECASELFRAQKKTASLLPVGVTSVEGDFEKGDVVEIRDQHGVRIGFGIVACDADQARAVAGKKGGRAVVHYDYLVVE
jgi:glutamate 5-kinase